MRHRAINSDIENPFPIIKHKAINSVPGVRSEPRFSCQFNSYKKKNHTKKEHKTPFCKEWLRKQSTPEFTAIPICGRESCADTTDKSS